MNTRMASGPEAEAEAVRILRSGGLVAVPTETVYGLAANATDGDAVLGIFEAKERPLFDPLIVHLPEVAWLDRIAREVPPMAKVLAAAFWPGPLTLVLPRTNAVPDVVTSGLETVAVRISAHPVLRRILDALDLPVAAPSANRFGRISPTRAEHAVGELAGRIPLVVDGGPCPHGVESTIVAVRGKRIEILRPGPVTPDALAAFGEVAFAGRGGVPDAPGQLPSHYAPVTPMRFLGEGCDGSRAGLLAWREGRPGFAAVEVLSSDGDAREAAATMFEKMRRLDAAGVETIYAERVPEEGLGIAIADRLRRACGLG